MALITHGFTSTPKDLFEVFRIAPRLIADQFLGVPRITPTLFGFAPEGILVVQPAIHPIDPPFLQSVRATFFEHYVERYLYIHHTSLTQQIPSPIDLEIFYLIAADAEQAAISYITVDRPNSSAAVLASHEAHFFSLERGDGSPLSWVLNENLNLGRVARTIPLSIC